MFSQFTHADSLRGFLFPERSCYDVTYYKLLLEVDPSARSIKGVVDITYEVVEPTARIQIDLYENWEVSRVVQDADIKERTREGSALFLDFHQELERGAVRTVTIDYSGTPQEAENAPWDGGFVWSQDPDGEPWIGVACEGDGASLWWPCKDHLSDEPDSVRITVKVPSNLKAVCNGMLEKHFDDGNGLASYTWFVSNPINNYNVTLNIADYAHFSDTFYGEYGPLPLDYWVLKSNLEKAKKHFEQVKPMLACFEEHFGPYPFYEDGYKLVETPYLGMEHQSAIAYGNNYLKGYSGMDWSGTGFDYIIIHESGHEWFGNSLSAPDLAELWIHESFTTYSEAIYLECMYDYQTAIDYLNVQRLFISNRAPIVGPLGVAFDNFQDTDMYYKGAFMLQTVRKVINNDSMWFALLRDFCETFWHQIIETQDVIDFFSQLSGSNLQPVFEQYLFGSTIPRLEYKLKEKRSDLEISYRWASVGDDFTMPAEISYSPIGTVWERITATSSWQKLKVPGAKAADFKLNTEEFYIKAKEL